MLFQIMIIFKLNLLTKNRKLMLMNLKLNRKVSKIKNKIFTSLISVNRNNLDIQILLGTNNFNLWGNNKMIIQIQIRALN